MPKMSRKGTKMKNIYALISVTIILSMLFLPILCVKTGKKEGEVKPAPQEEEEEDIFEVYFPEEDKVEKMTAEDYIICVVSAEMPAEYETEALKAQAVAAYTFASYRRNLRKEGKSDKNYDVAADHTTDQAFVSDRKRRENWGENSEKYSEKIDSAVKEVIGKKMTYDGEIILAAYYAISSGRTENCLDIWGSDRAYLVSVDSSFDKQSPKYEVETVFSEQTLKEKLADICDFSADENSFSINARSDGGSVMSVTVCGKTIKGTSLRTLLSLRSANFSIEYLAEDKSFKITTYGYGHGIGMSQYGANCLAKQGKTYEEILKYYYTGVKIE